MTPPKSSLRKSPVTYGKSGRPKIIFDHNITAWNSYYYKLAIKCIPTSVSLESISMGQLQL